MSQTVQNEEQVQRFYGREARLHLYDRLTWVTFLGQGDKLRQKMVSNLGLRPGERVLDIGCGTGLNLPHLKAAVGPEGEIDGIDLTPEMLSLAKRRAKNSNWNNVNLGQGDATKLPFTDGVFDGVCSTLALSVVPDWKLALREAWRVLKPGGSFAVLDASSLEGKWKKLAPIIHPIYRKFAVWQPDVEFDTGLAEIAPDCRVERPLGGLYYIAWAKKPS